LDPDLVQLHGSEAPERVAEIRQRSGHPVIKAVRVGGAEDVEAARAYEKGADFILYDAKPPASAAGALPGGNGVPFDWEALALATGGTPRTGFFLSGGLDPDNVAAAIRLTGAPIVDVSSGVETAPGEKDPELIRRFISAAKSLS
ncbi:MAG: phosphoribosylanthranilate isomerase, partial [Alphaproteobacteria bacterium]